MFTLTDIEGFRALNGLAGRSDALDAVFIFGAQGLIIVMAALLAAYGILSWETSHFEGRFENLVHVTATAAIAFITERVIGFIWFRPRPFVALEHVVKLIDKDPAAKSFPSGHATLAFALAFALLIHNRRWGWIFVSLALLVGLSRVAVGVHYPSDVAGGLIVGLVAAVVAAPVKRVIEPLLDWIPFFRLHKRSGEPNDLL